MFSFVKCQNIKSGLGRVFVFIFENPTSNKHVNIHMFLCALFFYFSFLYWVLNKKKKKTKKNRLFFSIEFEVSGLWNIANCKVEKDRKGHLFDNNTICSWPKRTADVHVVMPMPRLLINIKITESILLSVCLPMGRLRLVCMYMNAKKSVSYIRRQIFDKLFFYWD